MTSALFRCRKCQREGFTEAGYRSHRCGPKGHKAGKPNKADMEEMAPKSGAGALELISHRGSTSDQGEELSALAAMMVKFDESVHSAYRDQMCYAFLAGVTLLRVKDLLPHGSLMSWREKHLPHISKTSINRYQKFAEELVGRFPSVGNLKEVQLLEAGTKLSKESEQEVFEAVREATDGKSLTDMYRDLGVIRQPKKPTYHPPKPGTPEQDAKMEAWMAADALMSLGLQMSELIRKENNTIDICPRDHTTGDVLHHPRAWVRGLCIDLGKRLDAAEHPKNRRPS